MRAFAVRVMVVVCLVFLAAGRLSAREDWIEVKSDHFTVVSNAGARDARTLVWRLEQVRNIMVNLWSWARADLNKPLRVIVLKDENAMRAFAPRYWEQRGGIRPASVWTTGADQHYLAIRADVDVESQGNVNPHVAAYFAYINLVMGQSLSRDIPLWLSRGLSGVLSNTLVTDEEVTLGAPIPWHLQLLRERARMALPRFLSVNGRERQLRSDEGQETFDAQSWAFVHFLMFGEQGARSDALNRFAAMVSAGKDPTAAFTETLGRPEALEAPFRAYFEQRVYPVRRVKSNLDVVRDRFPVRPMDAAESASVRALFHVAMQRPVEARAAIAEARKVNAQHPGSYEAEGLLLDREDKTDEARAALTRAVDAKSANSFVYYRLASLLWRSNAEREVLQTIERHLAQATALNPRFAHAYSWLAEIRGTLGIGEPAGLAMRAITLEPREPVHRVRAASVFARQQKFDEAETQAKLALSLADSDDERQRAQSVLDWVARSRSAAAAPAQASPAQASPAAAASTAAPAPAMSTQANACQSGDNDACVKVLPMAESACAQKNANACGFAGQVYERGRGVPADRTRAAGFYQQACDAGAVEGCTQLAVLTAAGGQPADLTRARELLTKACEAKSPRACELVKSLSK